MATDKMYDLAFQYKGTKLWQQFYDDELFAVKLSDGEIGYCCVMGMIGQHNALALYVGDEGYQSYQLLRNTDQDGITDQMMGELVTSQSCLQCSFETKDMLSDAELAEVRRYAETHGKTLRGKNAFPQFTKYRPGRFPWHYDSELDGQRICDALSAAVALKKMLRKTSKEDLGFCSVDEEPERIPMLALADGRWVIKYTTLPAAGMRYPEPALANDVTVARIKRKAKAGVWECGTLRLPNPVQEEGHEDEAPYYPLALIFIELGNELVQQPIVTDGEDSSEMLKEFAEYLLTVKTIPRTIRCGDDRCYALLKNLCAKTGITLERTDEPEALEDVIDDLLDHMSELQDEEIGPDEIEEMFDVLMRMPDSELHQMPQELVNMLYSLAEAGELPAPLEQRIRKLFREKQK